MDQVLWTAEHEDQAKLLYIKKYQFPLTFNSTDEQILTRLESQKYATIHSPQLPRNDFCSDNVGFERSTPSSVLSTYSMVVQDNRLIKRQWERVRLVDLEDEMKNDEEHFKATSFFYAVFVNYLRSDLFQLHFFFDNFIQRNYS